MNTRLPSPDAAPSVTTATLGELDLLAPLFDAYRQFYGQAPDLERARRFLRDRIERRESVVLVANASHAGSRPLGFCQLYPTFCSVETTPIYVLYDLFVDPSSRRAGIGRALLQAAERLAAVNGMTRLELRTARDNQPAQAAYESLDWLRDERFFAYVKSLTPTEERQSPAG